MALRLVLALLTGSLLAGGKTSATVECWWPIRGDAKVYVNFCSNHDYYSRADAMGYRHELYALDYVRETLVQEKRIRDLPLLVLLAGGFPGFGVPNSVGTYVPAFTEEPRMSAFFAEDGVLWEGEGFESQKLGRCHGIHVRGVKDATWETLLLLTLALQHLDAASPARGFANLDEVRKLVETDVARFSSIRVHLDPLWSPDASSLIYTVWENGAVHLELATISDRTVLELEPLKGYLACAPCWSADSRYVAYSSLKETRVFDVKQGTGRLVELPEPEYPFERVLTFGKTSGDLSIVFDHGAKAGWEFWGYSPKTQRVLKVPSNGLPEWFPLARERGSPFRGCTRAASPDGKYIATIEKENGMGRLRVRTSRGELIEFSRPAGPPAPAAP